MGARGRAARAGAPGELICAPFPCLGSAVAVPPRHASARMLRRAMATATASASAARSLTVELNARVSADGIVVRAPVTAEHADIVTPDALRFLAKLHRYAHGRTDARRRVAARRDGHPAHPAGLAARRRAGPSMDAGSSSCGAARSVRRPSTPASCQTSCPRRPPSAPPRGKAPTYALARHARTRASRHRASHLFARTRPHPTPPSRSRAARP